MTWQDILKEEIKKEDSPLFDAAKMKEWLNNEGPQVVNSGMDAVNSEASFKIKTVSINFTQFGGKSIEANGEFDYSGKDESGESIQGKGTYSIKGKSKQTLEGMYQVYTGKDGISLSNPDIQLDSPLQGMNSTRFDPARAAEKIIKAAVYKRLQYILEHQHLLRRESEAVPDYGQKGVHTKDYSPKNKEDRWQDVMRTKTPKDGFAEAYKSAKESEYREVPLSSKRIKKMIEVFGDEVKIESEQNYSFNKTIPFEDNAISFHIDESHNLRGLTGESSDGSKYGIALFAGFKLPKGVGFVHGNDSRTVTGRKQPDGEQRKAFVKDFAKYKAMSQKDLFFLLLRA